MERIKTGKNHGVCVYHDTSSRGYRITKTGKKQLRRHDCWRADVTINDTGGLRRIRRRFKNKADADAWLGRWRFDSGR